MWRIWSKMMSEAIHAIWVGDWRKKDGDPGECVCYISARWALPQLSLRRIGDSGSSGYNLLSWIMMNVKKKKNFFNVSTTLFWLCDNYYRTFKLTIWIGFWIAAMEQLCSFSCSYPKVSEPISPNDPFRANTSSYSPPGPEGSGTSMLFKASDASWTGGWRGFTFVWGMGNEADGHAGK